MYIPWEWIRKEIGCEQNYSSKSLIEQLNYCGLECEESFAKEILFINFITSHKRRDLRSWRGIAKEISILLDLKRKIPVERKQSKEENKASFRTIKLLISSDKVIKYNGSILSGITVNKEIPLWITSSLTKNGIRSISAIVDLTNFVTLETGQPLHAFDLEKIQAISSDCEVIVGEANGGEEFIDLSGKKRELNTGDLVTKVAGEVVELAGIIGGANTAIGVETKSVFIESASFLASAIEKTKKKLMVQTNASDVFINYYDSETEEAIERFEQLVQEFCSYSREKSEYFSFSQLVQITRKLLEVNLLFFQQKLGTKITEKSLEVILKRLGFSFEKGKEGNYVIEIPSSRVDINIKEDLLEEVGKLLDYNKLTGKLPSSRNEFVDLSFNRDYDTRKKLAHYLISNGYQEIISYSLVANNLQKNQNGISLSNPRSSDRAQYRSSLIKSHLEIIKHNQRQGNENIFLFEIGKTYKNKVEDSFIQEEMLLVSAVGNFIDLHVHKLSYHFDFYWAKGLVENVTALLGLFQVEIEKGLFDKEQNLYYPVYIDKQQIGTITKVSEKNLQWVGIKKIECFMIELSLSKLLTLNIQQSKKKYSPVSYLPIITKNISFFADKNISLNEITTTITEKAGEFLINASLFDVYDKQKKDSLHSLNFKLLFQGKQVNLQNAELEVFVERIWAVLEEKFKVLRR